MRAALISIAGQPRDAANGAVLSLAGKTLAERQLAFALAAGAERIFVLGEGSDADALVQSAARRSAKASTIGDAHGLLGALSAADELLVMAPGVLPESAKALILLEKQAVLVLPAAQAIPAGFERIDAERAWAGAMLIPGNTVERLAQLPADSEATSALLRIALQARVPERRLAETVLADGSWIKLGVPGAEAIDEMAWMQRQMPGQSGAPPARWLARKVLQRAALPILQRGPVAPWLSAGALAFLAGGVVSSWLGVPALGFGLIAAGTVGAEFVHGFAQFMAAPFPPPKRAQVEARIGSEAVAIALLLCAIFAIGGSWLHKLFPPLVLLGLLRIAVPDAWPKQARALADPFVLAALLSLAALLGLVEPAIMLLSLTLIALTAFARGS